MTTKHISHVICLATLLIAVACEPTRPRAEPGGTQQWDPDLVEAVFRRQIGDSNIHLVSVRKNVYLSILGGDAPLELIQRLMNSDLQVYRGSEFKPGKGILHRIDRIELVDASHALVDGSWSQDGSQFTDYRYQLQRRDGRWKVMQATLIRRP